MLKPIRSRLAALLAGSLLFGAVAARAADITNEYRLTAYPSYRLTDKIRGFGYVGSSPSPMATTPPTTWATGAFSQPEPWLQLWARPHRRLHRFQPGERRPASTLELRPFVGVKFMGDNQSTKWRYYNWTRYELRSSRHPDTGYWTTVQRLRNQVPHRDSSRGEGAGLDAEDLVPAGRRRADLALRHGSDRSAAASGRLGYIANPRLLVEFQYYIQFTQPGGGPRVHGQHHPPELQGSDQGWPTGRPWQ